MPPSPAAAPAPYRLGFTTLAAETLAPVELPLTGTFPGWLAGTLLRTGPARFEVGRRSFNHWFDGLAMLHRFSFAAGRVTYQSRYLHSQAYELAAASGKISRREFATDPCRSIFQRVLALFFPEPFTDNGSVNVVRWHEEVLALTETRLPVRFDPATLATVGLREYDRTIPGAVSTAHPHFDRQRGRHYNYLIDFGRHSKYHLLAIDDATGRQSILATIPVDRPAYMHSFAMTERYLVLAEFPLVVSPLRLLLSGQPFIRNYRWQPERGVRLHVVEKDSGRLVRTAQAPACFAFHHVNAFEAAGDILIDLVTRPDPAIVDELYLDRLRTAAPVNPTGTLTRLRIAGITERASGAQHTEENAETMVTSTQLSTVTLELPRFNYGRAGLPYRYVYGASQHTPGEFFDSLVKVDLDGGSSAAWREPGCYPGEPIFVAAPAPGTGPAAEDAGVILSVVLDTRRAASFLLILDAASFSELARAPAPHHIPFSFHGNYFG
jgi:carotenoid cleavage dioxygenase-like enzyme